MEDDIKRVRFNQRYVDVLRRTGWNPIDATIGGKFVIVRWKTRTEADNIAFKMNHEVFFDAELGWCSFFAIPD